MDFLALSRLVALGPALTDVLTHGISFKSVLGLVNDPPVLRFAEQWGATMFPKLAPELHAVAAIAQAFNPDYTKWLQNALNALVSPSPNLDVDGEYGPMTRAATEKLQAQLGLKVDGWAGDISSAAIQFALSKLK